MSCRNSFIYLLLLVVNIGCKPQKNVSKNYEGQQVVSFEGYEMIMKDGERARFRTNDDSKVYFFFRHAEKDTIVIDNPSLTEEGIQRAEYLVKMFAGTKVDSLYSTMYNRTMFTIDKLARTKGKKMKSYDPEKLKEFATKLEMSSAGVNHVIVGHSNTTPDLVNHLMGESLVGYIDESDYNNMFIVEIDGSNKKLKKLTFKVN